MGATSDIAYAQHPDATAAAEISALANVYRLVLDRRTKGAAPESRPDDPEGISDEIRTGTVIPDE